MSEAITYRHIIKQSGVPAGLESHPKIRVADVVLPHLAHGWSADELHRQFPHLTLGEIHACLGYYFDNPAEIEATIESDRKLDAELKKSWERSPLAVRLRNITR